MKDYSQNYNKGNDCDACQNQYLCGRDGDATGCKRFDDELDCEYIESVDESICSKCGQPMQLMGYHDEDTNNPYPWYWCDACDPKGPY